MNTPDAAIRPSAPAISKMAFFRVCRTLHAYLSALAFLALLFFAVTGLLLNHPDWLPATQSVAGETRVTLTPAEIADALHAADPGRALAGTTARKTKLLGDYRSGEIVGGEADLRLEGVRGVSTVAIDLKTGAAAIAVEPANLAAMIYDLHRGKNAGQVWSSVIDITALLIVALSAIGFILFISLRAPRPAANFAIVAASLVAGAAIFAFFVA